MARRARCAGRTYATIAPSGSMQVLGRNFGTSTLHLLKALPFAQLRIRVLNKRRKSSNLIITNYFFQKFALIRYETFHSLKLVLVLVELFIAPDKRFTFRDWYIIFFKNTAFNEIEADLYYYTS